MNKEELKQYIDDNIYENQDGEITGESLNAVLKAIVDDGGTEVEANPTGDPTDTLEKIKIGEGIYEIPETDTSNLATKQELQQGLSGKQDTISDLQQIRTRADEGHTALQPIQDATPNNFVSFDANGGIKDSGKKDTDFATAAQGTKADNAIPMPIGTDGQILEKDSNETSGVKWVNKPSDGQDGASAYELYEQAEIAAGRTPLSQEAWLASLKANIGEFLFVPTDSAAVTAMATIGQTYSSAIDPLGKNVVPSQNTLSVILLMNDDATTPTKTMMIVTQDDGNSGFEFVYAGDLQSAMPSDVLTQANIVNDLTTGGVDDVLSAEQGKTLEGEVSQLEAEVYGLDIDETIPFSDFTVSNKGIFVADPSNYGTEGSTNGWYCTDYIALPDGVATLKYLGGANANTFGIAFYDGNKSPNAPNPLSTDYVAKTTESTLSVPTGSRYFRASGKSGAYVEYSVQSEGDIQKIQQDITEIDGTLVSLGGRIQSIEDELGEQVVIDKEFDKTDLIPGYYGITSGGKLSVIIDPDSTGWSCLITEIMAGETVDVKTQGGNNAKGWYLCDGEKNVLSYAQSSGILDEHLTASVSGYLAVCTNNTYKDSFSVIIKKTTKELSERVADNETEIANLEEEFVELDGRVTEVENKTEDIPTYDKFGLEVYGEEPPSVMKESPSFCSIVRTWGFIGDSFSSGYFDINSSTGGITDYDYSWCQMFARLNSALVAYNYAEGGMTAKGWCTVLDGGTRRWNNGTGKILELKQAYVIQLGSNDSNDASLVAGDLSTDVDLNDYSNNADTFAGWIAGVIQRVKSINPKAFFFVATVRHNGVAEKRFAFSEIIRQLPTIFTNVYIVDIERYGLHWLEQDVISKFKSGTHPSPTGNYYQAIMYNTIIDWIISRNMADFKEIQFVGTDYHN